MVLLLGITLPAFAAALNPAPLGLGDAAALGLWCLLFAGEVTADNTQRRFQREKYRRIASGEELTAEQKRGFCSSGVFSVSRHLNFCCEQGMWLTVALWGAVGAGGAEAWFALPNNSLVGLFKGFTDITERISASKYPAYREYQRRVNRFLPHPVRLLQWAAGREVDPFAKSA